MKLSQHVRGLRAVIGESAADDIASDIEELESKLDRCIEVDDFTKHTEHPFEWRYMVKYQSGAAIGRTLPEALRVLADLMEPPK